MKPNYNKIATLITIMLLIGSGCSTLNPFAKEDFETFYKKFHADTTFQLSRIKFPIDGVLVSPNGEKNWTAENWIPLTTPVHKTDTTRFEVEYKKGNDTFTQKSWIKNSGFATEYRFELKKRKWFLVYAYEQNL